MAGNPADNPLFLLTIRPGCLWSWKISLVTIFSFRGRTTRKIPSCINSVSLTLQILHWLIILSYLYSASERARIIAKQIYNKRLLIIVNVLSTVKHLRKKRYVWIYTGTDM